MRCEIIERRTGFGGIGDRIDPTKDHYICIFPIRESRLFYFVYVIIGLVEELVVEREMVLGSRVNPE